jgi:malate synthase
MQTDLTIRPDILEAYPDLFGSKRVGGRTVNVEELIGSLTRATRDEFHQLLHARHELQARVAAGQARFDFLDGNLVIRDPDGNSATVADIRQGMLDGFFGRKSDRSWRVAARRPIPADTMRPGLEGTGPCIDLGMAFGALNSGASSWMWDWEDAGGDFRDQLYQAWRNLKQILAHEWDHKPFVHATKTMKDAKGGVAPREYRINVPPSEWPTIFHRVPGLHLVNRQISLGGSDVPATIPALVIHALNNFDSQVKNGSGIYYYVPKLESWQEARLVGTLLKALEEAMGVERGTLKIKVLNERAEFVLQQEAIEWVLRENLIGPNVGRWDYINSREDMFHHDPDMVIPNPTAVTMTEPSMTHYTRRNALLAMLAGAMPIGGMAAQMQNPRAPENDVKALRDIWFDKLRERLTGLFVIAGTLHDTYRQSWVATVSREYVAAGQESLVPDFSQLQQVVDRATPEERGRLEALGLLKDGRIAPLELSEADLTVEKLFSSQERTRLLARPQGPTTEDGLRYAMYMATEYMYQQLQGNNAAAIDDPNTGLRFMNDLATYEIFWHFLYLTVAHGARLTDDGRYAKKGDPVTADLFLKLLDERRDAVKQFFAKRAVKYEDTDAELVLQILKRQIVDAGPGGKAVPQKRWIKYGSRVLLSLVEQSAENRRAILDGVFADRVDLMRAVESAASSPERERARKALAAHDYVYDVFAAAGAGA